MNFQIFKLDLERQRNHRSNCQHSLDHWKSKRIPEKHLLLLYWLCRSLWLCGSQQRVENSSRDGNTRPPDLPPEKPVCRSKSNRQNWTWNNRLVQNWERTTSGCILSPCLFNLYAEYIIQNAGLDEAQAGIKIARRNNNNLRYTDDTTLMAESEEELKSLLMKVKEERVKVALKLNIQKTKIKASSSITSWKIDEETMENSERLDLGGLQNHYRWWLHPWN